MSLKRGALAAVGCLVMQVPYAVAGNPRDAGVVGSVLCSLVPVDVKTEWDGYDSHWWWDNLAHYLAGYAIGSVLSMFTDDSQRVVTWFCIITGVWELFEYAGNERPWHTDENGDMVWSLDHAMEDTVLDSVMGATGAYVAVQS